MQNTFYTDSFETAYIDYIIAQANPFMCAIIIVKLIFIVLIITIFLFDDVVFFLPDPALIFLR